MKYTFYLFIFTNIVFANTDYEKVINSMKPSNIEILAITTFKISVLVAGLICVYLGYKLFVKGIWGKSGDIKTKFQDNKIVIRNAAPGTIFALVGLSVILYVTFKGPDFSRNLNTKAEKQIDRKKIDRKQIDNSDLKNDEIKKLLELNKIGEKG